MLETKKLYKGCNIHPPTRFSSASLLYFSGSKCIFIILKLNWLMQNVIALYVCGLLILRVSLSCPLYIWAQVFHYNSDNWSDTEHFHYCIHEPATLHEEILVGFLIPKTQVLTEILSILLKSNDSDEYSMTVYVMQSGFLFIMVIISDNETNTMRIITL